MRITLIDYTRNAKEILILSKNTRHLSGDTRFDDIIKMDNDTKNSELEYVFGTISSAWEFVDYTFLIQDVSRAYTHQQVRHRVMSFSQQSLRVFPAESFSYYIPPNIEKDRFQLAVYEAAMKNIQNNYNVLLHKGADIQDARGILPTNICTHILVKANLRALSNLMETRLCVRAQGEFQDAALTMKELVKEVHPWAEHVLNPCCILHGYCQFKNFECPLKVKYKHLQPVSDETKKALSDDWGALMEHGYSPQPKQQI